MVLSLEKVAVCSSAPLYPRYGLNGPPPADNPVHGLPALTIYGTLALALPAGFTVIGFNPLDVSDGIWFAASASACRPPAAPMVWPSMPQPAIVIRAPVPS